MPQEILSNSLVKISSNSSKKNDVWSLDEIFEYFFMNTLTVPLGVQSVLVKSFITIDEDGHFIVTVYKKKIRN